MMEANEGKIIMGGNIIGGQIKRPENSTSAMGWGPQTESEHLRIL